MDRFQQKIDTHCEGIECLSDRFAVLEPRNLIENSETELPKFEQSLIENYYELSANSILTEIPHIRRFPKAVNIPKEVSWLDFLKILRVCG
ncbi:hypothetical protein AVEN_193126-1 [Araneus ventricosus]|uniref:Uncharacterized protein n=1 Tax=Araneus ventricosus TaxID=182803 RepID=A0A4Y2B311_ARAVE|nr:hypothetical protein AVEN_193126-1 [Araneus ventricosus]